MRSTPSACMHAYSNISWFYNSMIVVSASSTLTTSSKCFLVGLKNILLVFEVHCHWYNTLMHNLYTYWTSDLCMYLDK